MNDLMTFAAAFALATLALTIALVILLALNRGAQAAWRAVFKTQPPFGIFSVAAMAVSLSLAAFVVYVIHAFATLFASFGTDLPAPTLLLIKYGDLLPLVVFLLLLALLYVLRKNVRRERYFAVILCVELTVIALAVGTLLYLPVYKVGEAV